MRLSLLLPAGRMPSLASRSWRSPLQLATGGCLAPTPFPSHPPPSDTRATLASHWCTPTRNCATHQLARMDNLRTEKCATHPRMDNLRNCETVKLCHSPRMDNLRTPHPAFCTLHCRCAQSQVSLSEPQTTHFSLTSFQEYLLAVCS